MSLVDSFTHLKGRPRSDQALPLLKRIASLVKPVMRKHSWRLPVLAEFFPDEPSLLGLNMNSGQKILLRLRPPWSPVTFYDEEQLVSVMLHELTHNVQGPHDEKFYKYLSELEAEYDVYRRNGYDGEGFQSAGRRLGVGVPHNLSPHLARAKALQAAEKRKAVQKALGGLGGHRLGGRPIGLTALSPRELAVQAAQRRARDERSCGTSKESAQREAEKAANDSVEDKAEVVEPARGNSNFSIDDSPGIGGTKSSPLSNENSWPCELCTLDNPPSASYCLVCLTARPRGNNGSPTVHAAAAAVSSSRNSSQLLGTARNSSLATASVPSINVDSETIEVGWSCPTCTLHNPGHILQCSLCAALRPKQILTDDWTCMACGEEGMPHEFWSCRFCGRIKDSSASA